MQRRFLAEADLTLKKASQLIQGMEDAAKNAEEMQRENSTQQAAATNVVHSTDPKAKKFSCSRYLGTSHNQAMCKYKIAKCNKCHKVGHLARAYYRLQPRRQEQGVKGQHTGQSNKGKGHVRQVTDNPNEQVADIVNIYTVTEGLPGSYKVIMQSMLRFFASKIIYGSKHWPICICCIHACNNCDLRFVAQSTIPHFLLSCLLIHKENDALRAFQTCRCYKFVLACPSNYFQPRRFSN